MSDDEADPELLELLRAALGGQPKDDDQLSRDTGVRQSARHIADCAIDVAIDYQSTKSAAKRISSRLVKTEYSPSKAWNDNELHPKLDIDLDGESMTNFVFTMDCLNFCFWSEQSDADRYQVEYRGCRWTGYMSLVACLRRALEEKIPITTPCFWRREECSDALISHVFRSATDEKIPLLFERIAILREVGSILKPDDEEIPHQVDAVPALDHLEASLNQDVSGHTSSDIPRYMHEALDAPNRADLDRIPSSEPTLASDTLAPERSPYRSYTDDTVIQLISQADGSAGRLVNLLAQTFPSFQDEGRFDDLYSAFANSGPGRFDDIDELTMFADYRVPQQLQRMSVLRYCPALELQLKRGAILPHGSSWEMQIRGCSIQAVELLKHEVEQLTNQQVSAILLDFLLYTISKELELTAGSLPHHRTKSIWY